MAARFSLDLDFSFSFADKNPFVLAPKLQTDAKRIAIFGPSGSGKSLTMHCIAGLLKPDSGYIQISARQVFNSNNNINLPSHKRRLAYLFQDYALFPHLTVKQNIGFGLDKSWLNPSRKKPLPAAAMHWVKAFNLSALLDRYPDQISGGQAQRVALARSLSIQPDVILLDEPLSALDNDLRKKMQLELLSLQNSIDVPTVLISHDATEAELLADDVFYMQNGRIVAC